jgi:hypothetical protein
VKLDNCNVPANWTDTYVRMRWYICACANRSTYASRFPTTTGSAYSLFATHPNTMLICATVTQTRLFAIVKWAPRSLWARARSSSACVSGVPLMSGNGEPVSYVGFIISSRSFTAEIRTAGPLLAYVWRLQCDVVVHHVHHDHERPIPQLREFWRAQRHGHGMLLLILAQRDYMLTFRQMEIGNGALTIQEQRTHFAVWIAMKSPILLGTNVRRIPSIQMTMLATYSLYAANGSLLRADCNRLEQRTPRVPPRHDDRYTRLALYAFDRRHD